MKFCIETLGCKVNQYESRAVAGLLISRGHTEVSPGEGCDVCVINTCAVTAESGRKSRQAVRHIKKLEPHAKITVCGCFSQISPEEIATLGADLVAGSGDRAKLARDIEHLASGGEKTITVGDAMARHEFEVLPHASSGSRTRAMLKIQDGCDNFCAYCIIPHARGPARSIPIAAAAEEARRLTDAGYREIVITGIEISSYGKDLDGVTLADAVTAIAAAAPDVRLRLGSLDPGSVTDGLCGRFRQIPNLCAHFHLSLQSGCDDTLRRMERKYNTAQAMHAIDSLRSLFPGCGITADLITGFPGESDTEFIETLAFIKTASFLRMHIFPFSERPGTPAASMPEQVEKRVRTERAKCAAALVSLCADEYRRGMTGTTVNVLFERESDGFSSGHAENYVEVFVKGTGLHNRVLPVKIIGIHSGRVVGEIMIDKGDIWMIC